MKVLFIEPPPSLDWTPENKITTAGRRHPSLNVTGEKVYSYINLSSASVLRENGHDVKYIHCQTEDKSMDDLHNVFKNYQPDLTVQMIEHINLGVHDKVAQMAKDDSDSKVAFVGPFATPLHKKVIKLNADYVLRKEWDYSVNALASAIEDQKKLSSVKGLTFKEKNQIVVNPDAPLINNLDELPIPAYDLVDHTKFYEAVFKRFPTATAITSRGCPFQCVYCVFPNTIYSHKWRAQSPKRVLDETKYLVDEFGIKEIRFDDDTFEVDRKRVFDVCTLFKKEKMDFVWAPQSRPSLIDFKLAKKMKSAGCTRILYGVESGDNEILKKIKKGTTTAKIRAGVKNAKKAGIDVLNCVMIGFLWDTKKTIKKTIDFAFDLNAEFTQFSIATPLPGTEYYELLKKNNYLISDKWEDSDSFHHANFNYPNMSGEEISGMLKGIYRKYYTRPQYLGMMLKWALKEKDNLKQMYRLGNAFVARYKEGWI